VKSVEVARTGWRLVPRFNWNIGRFVADGVALVAFELCATAGAIGAGAGAGPTAMSFQWKAGKWSR
jgi:hypothetical protein